jgi:hypothetical protein
MSLGVPDCLDLGMCEDAISLALSALGVWHPHHDGRMARPSSNSSFILSLSNCGRFLPQNVIADCGLREASRLPCNPKTGYILFSIVLAKPRKRKGGALEASRCVLEA